jgi:hypothetical protein
MRMRTLVMRLPTATRAASAISGSARLRLGPSGLDDRNDVLGRKCRAIRADSMPQAVHRGICDRDGHGVKAIDGRRLRTADMVMVPVRIHLHATAVIEARAGRPPSAGDKADAEDHGDGNIDGENHHHGAQAGERQRGEAPIAWFYRATSSKGLRKAV